MNTSDHTAETEGRGDSIRVGVLMGIRFVIVAGLCIGGDLVLWLVVPTTYASQHIAFLLMIESLVCVIVAICNLTVMLQRGQKNKALGLILTTLLGVPILVAVCMTAERVAGLVLWFTAWK